MKGLLGVEIVQIGKQSNEASVKRELKIKKNKSESAGWIRKW